MRLKPVRTALLCAGLALGCSSGSGAPGGPVESEDGVGTLVLGLDLGTGEYRLDGATYAVTPSDGREVSSQAGDGEEFFSALPAGPCAITLLDGWQVVRLEASGEVPVPAVLVSENPTFVDVLPNEAIQVTFDFAVAGPEQAQGGERASMIDGGAPPISNDGGVSQPDEPDPGAVLYTDADGDGYGDSQSPWTSGAAGIGVASDTDCDDTNAAVSPDQTEGFSEPTAAGSFDYDCDGVEESVSDTTLFQCGAFGVACQSGFRGAVPACGETGTWADCSLFFICIDREETVLCR